jgi:beta-lactamase class A
VLLRPVAMTLALLAVACEQPLGLPSLPPFPSLPPAVAGEQRAPRADATELRRRVDALVAEFPGSAAVWISDAGDPRPLYARAEDEEVLAASLWKLGALVHVESLVERRELRYEDTITVQAEDVGADGSLVVPGGEVTVDEALELMTAHSDNGTALAFLRIHGGEAMNASLRRAGIGGIRVQPGRDDENTITARGVGTLMQRLAERRLVSPAASDRMVARLERQEVTGRSDTYLPPGTRLAHKTGDVVGAAHDAAVVWTKLGPRVVVVLTWDAGGDEAHELIARVAQAAFETAK